MHKLLADWLLKLKVDMASMDAEEKATFDRYNAILTDEELTPESIANFCDIQRGEIEKIWSNVDNSSQKNDRLITYHTVYGKISKMIRAKRLEREALERDLQNQLDQK